MEVNFESEVPAMDTVTTALSLDNASVVVQDSDSEPQQQHTPPEPVCDTTVQEILSNVVKAIRGLGFDCDENPFNVYGGIVECTPEFCACAPQGSAPPSVRSSPTKSWTKNYSALSFMMNGQLFAEYERVTNMLGIPSCSKTQWSRITEWTEKHVTELANWSCEQVRNQIRQRGDHQQWVASYDGFYLTRGHHSNNSSATLHDYRTGNIAWFAHRTKRGPGHNWEGTSNAAEGSMFDELLEKAKNEKFVIKEIVTDKDSSGNAIFCNHFPEGSITYCSNHSAKTLHKELQKIKSVKCTVCELYVAIYY